MFASEHFGIEPDIMCLAKALAGGFPMGAVLCSDKIELSPGKHGGTFNGNPLACAAANAAIDFMLEQDLAKQAHEKGEYFVSRFAELDLGKVREVRALGLMIGIELKEKVQPHLISLIEAGVLALPAGATVLRLLPPLTINYPELDAVVERLQCTLRS